MWWYGRLSVPILTAKVYRYPARGRIRRAMLGMRIAKTAAQKLADLEDHLFLLVNALAGFDSGQGAHLRHIAAELRVLICLSSGTEGLLWRLVDELHVDDAVQVHRVMNVNPRHPLSQGLRFMFLPLRSPGRGDPRLPVGIYSLRDIIKTAEAVFVAGRGVTHEDLLKWLSQQVGSAHESETVSDVLAELNAIRIANVQPFFYILHSDATLTIEVAERVLQKATADLGYQRRHPNPSGQGTPYLAEALAVTAPLDAPTVDPVGIDEGSAVFLLNNPDPAWRQAGITCTFAPYTVGRLTFQATKTADGFLEVTVAGLFVPEFTRRWPLPALDDKGLVIAITWKRPEILIYLKGALVDTIHLALPFESPSSSPET